MVCIRPHLVEAMARRVTAAFAGDILYAVKCNETAQVLQALWRGGVRHYDTASIGEIRHVRALLPQARCHFMHPVKSAEAIAEAYHAHGVRRFVYDHADELAKILAATDGATDLELYVRLAVPGQGALLSLTGKFGVDKAEAVRLLWLARPHAAALGLTFHVGSQCIDPEAYAAAIAMAGEVARRAGGIADLDIGGGFPAIYDGSEPEIEAFFARIGTAVRAAGLEGVRLQAEPGRALVAEGASVMARVELRRDGQLYLNDGVYGNLAELKWIGPRFPVRVVRPSGPVQGRQRGFDLFGPTCDSIDSMPGPHRMADSVAEGDWIEVGMMGAYSNALRTGFNGFGETGIALLRDAGWYLPDMLDRRVAVAA